MRDGSESSPVQMEASRKQATQDDTGTYIGSMTTEEGGDASTSDLDSFVRPAGQNPSQFTFYREGTPPPPPSYRQGYGHDAKENELSRSSIPPIAGIPGLAEAGGDSDDNEAGRGEGEKTRAKATICGMRRPVFGKVVIITVLVVICLCLGLGLGLGIPRLKTEVAVPGASATSGVPDSATPASSAPTRTETSMVSATPTALAAAECPEANGTTYAVPGTEKGALILCGIDYSSARGEAVELGQALAETMAECIQNCVEFSGCTACGWGFIQGDKGDALRCWLKGNLAQYHTARANWSFAILQPSMDDDNER